MGRFRGDRDHDVGEDDHHVDAVAAHRLAGELGPRSGSRTASRMLPSPHSARKPGSERPAWRMNHTGEAPTGSHRHAERKSESATGTQRPYRRGPTQPRGSFVTLRCLGVSAQMRRSQVTGSDSPSAGSPRPPQDASRHFVVALAGFLTRSEPEYRLDVACGVPGAGGRQAGPAGNNFAARDCGTAPARAPCRRVSDRRCEGRLRVAGRLESALHRAPRGGMMER